MRDRKPGAAWEEFYEATAGRMPRRTLLKALDEFGLLAGRAVDLGCGDGRDTVEMLRRGWSVIAVDAEPRALERLKARSDLPPAAKLTILLGAFQDERVAWPAADLINASFSLPLCPPASFPVLWRKIAASLGAGGRFAGQLYGDRDGWADRRDLTIFDGTSAHRLFDGYALELFEEEESDTVTPRGKPKHWHIFHIVARKR